MAKLKRRSRPKGNKGDLVVINRDIGYAQVSARYPLKKDVPFSIPVAKGTEGIKVGTAPAAPHLLEVLVPYNNDSVYVEMNPHDVDFI